MATPEEKVTEVGLVGAVLFGELDGPLKVNVWVPA